MIATAIKQIKAWNDTGLPFKVAFRNLFLSKLVPRFTYAFSLISLEECDRNLELIETTLGRALCSTFGWSVPKRFKIQPGIWFAVCGFPSAFALLRKLKLDLAVQLKFGDNIGGKIFRNLYVSDRGSFERDVHQALDQWLLKGLWDSLKVESVGVFKRKVSKISKKCWPNDLEMAGNLSWLLP